MHGGSFGQFETTQRRIAEQPPRIQGRLQHTVARTAVPPAVSPSRQAESAAQQPGAEERYRGELIEGIDIYNPMLMANTWEELGLREGDERLL